jgi:hypothetical protein
MGEKSVPFFFIGDDFALSENLVKVYPGRHSKGSKERIFSFRICRARRVVEDVFGLASSIFRVFRKPVLSEPENVHLVVMIIACSQDLMRFNN